jgi:hypothetical protein
MQTHGQIMILVLMATVWTAAPARAQQPPTAADYVELQMLNAYYMCRDSSSVTRAQAVDAVHRERQPYK